jgi:hypothetical protein
MQRYLSGDWRRNSMSQRKLYRSENGDTWWLCREDSRVYVLHEANLSSGGSRTEIQIGDFLAEGRAGPEHQALLKLIGTLAD